ncbi:MAG TPA: amidase, partial [Longimicrobiales bacterium]|nr:amidase [Longimicrobiales bacterium]
MGRMYNRRAFMAYFAGTGLTTTLMPGALWARLQQQPQDTITKEMVKDAEALAGLQFTDTEREAIVRGVNSNARSYAQLRTATINNSVLPAIQFDPVLPSMTLPSVRKPARYSKPNRVERPRNIEEIAFWPVLALAELVRARKVSPVELTELYLARLKKHGPTLEAVITLTDQRALKQARTAEADIKAGRYKGLLHGIPWGAKDLLAVKGYRTTWGAKPYENQMLDEDATVVKRLDDAGAILVAKLTLGALANGDVWYGGKTKNPWKLDQGSSGSSAGPGAATVAGLVAFAIGSETLGSIVSPSTRNGATGLRPTFGRVPRTGAMALSWSMDKLGPMARYVEDLAAIFPAIIGPDRADPTVRDVPFNWDAATDIRKLRIGYYKSAFDATENHATKAFDDAVLETFRSKLGVNLIPFETPTKLPLNALRIILNAEAAAAFDDITRSGAVNTMQDSSWPNSFRQSRFIPAVEYIQANRIRTLVMQEMAKAMESVDVVVTPSFGGNILLLTNLTGHPAVVVPSGFNTTDNTPVSISFVGKLFGEAETLAVAKAYQDATGFQLK